MITMSSNFKISRFKYLILVFLFINVKCAKVAVQMDAQSQAETLSPSDVEDNKFFTKQLSTFKKGSVILEGFLNCVTADCNKMCGGNESNSYCESDNKRLCMCSDENFVSSNVEGVVSPVNRNSIQERNCSIACNIRNSYGRIWHRRNKTKSCTCLINQVTKTGITLCDQYAINDNCKMVCKSSSAQCTFNGVCLCNRNWPAVFSSKDKEFRFEDKNETECKRKCRVFHSEYVGKLYDPIRAGNYSSYKFREKYCLCGEEVEPENKEMLDKLTKLGFQQCTALKCIFRCGMNLDAECEPEYGGACFCPVFNIFIGRHLWARLPSNEEVLCRETCTLHGLEPRIIEWNPFFFPENDWISGAYRASAFNYLYNGKFCHCINTTSLPAGNGITEFNTCTDELCAWVCGHYKATCEISTRRYCLCETHQLVGGLGRKPDPGESVCNILCRSNLVDARILDLSWDIAPPSWSGEKMKFCACIRPTSSAGLTHCEGTEGRDLCPQMCKNRFGYCTREKFCACNYHPDPLKHNGMIRIPNGIEYVECGDACRSWTWPLTADNGIKPYIYDESRINCWQNKTCPEIDTKAWSPSEPGAMRAMSDALGSGDNYRRFCLCIRNEKVYNKPGVRIPTYIEAPRLTKWLPCILNYTCMAVGQAVYIIESDIETIQN